MLTAGDFPAPSPKEARAQPGGPMRILTGRGAPGKLADQDQPSFT